MRSVLATHIEEGNTDRIFDSCAEVVKKIKQTLVDHPGLTKKAFREVVCGCSPATLDKFLMGKTQQNCQALMVYPLAYAFFERLRMMNGEPKSKARLKNEKDRPMGFDTSRRGNWTLEFCPKFN